MSSQNIDAVYQIMEYLKLQMNQVQDMLRYNLSRIAEIDIYLKSMEQGNADFDVFSPRSKESISHEEAAIMIEEKKRLEEENLNHYGMLDKLESNLHGMDDMLGVKDVSRNLQVLDIQEKERQRIARDLHDTSLQNLAHLVHKIELGSMYIDQDPLRAKLELAAAIKSLKAIIEDIRDTVFDLRPMTFDDLGLKESFERLFIKLKEGNAVDFIADIDEIESDNNLVLMSIFRVVQECCSNAMKHSGGNKIYVTIKHVGDVCDITIADNGCGFDVAAAIDEKNRHFGLLIMKERVKLLGGNMSLDSETGGGTKVHIAIPVVNRKRGA